MTTLTLPPNADMLAAVQLFEQLYRERFAWTSSLGWLINAGPFWQPNAGDELSLALADFVRQLAEAAEALPDGAHRDEWLHEVRHLQRLRTSRRSWFAQDAKTGLVRPDDAFDPDPTSRVVTYQSRWWRRPRYRRYFLRAASPNP